MIEAKIIADSINSLGHRITTMQLKYPRFIHSEFLTHRVFSRNASSSRAIPVAKMIDQVWNDPAMPVHWGQNQPGMQATEEIQHVKHAEDLWRSAANEAANRAQELADIGLHKQIVNRIIEPFLYVEGIVSSTEWENFFGLRAHPDAQPEIQELAYKMRDALSNSTPIHVYEYQWHLPYITDDEKSKYRDDILCKMSAARCCRVSYLKHDGTTPSIDDDLSLCDKLTKSVPIHASPFEHVAQPLSAIVQCGNFVGWKQYRKIIGG
jgi:thymidylate synthase ThyX